MCSLILQNELEELLKESTTSPEYIDGYTKDPNIKHYGRIEDALVCEGNTRKLPPILSSSAQIQISTNQYEHGHHSETKTACVVISAMVCEHTLNQCDLKDDQVLTFLGGALTAAMFQAGPVKDTILKETKKSAGSFLKIDDVATKTDADSCSLKLGLGIGTEWPGAKKLIDGLNREMKEKEGETQAYILMSKCYSFAVVHIRNFWYICDSHGKLWTSAFLDVNSDRSLPQQNHFQNKNWSGYVLRANGADEFVAMVEQLTQGDACASLHQLYARGGGLRDHALLPELPQSFARLLAGRYPRRYHHRPLFRAPWNASIPHQERAGEALQKDAVTKAESTATAEVRATPPSESGLPAADPSPSTFVKLQD